MSLRKKYYPWAAAVPPKFAESAATLFGLGNMPAPGTWGSAAGVLMYFLLFAQFGYGSVGFVRHLIFASLLAYIAVGICDAAERAFKRRDPGKIILDEFVAMNFCFLPIAQQQYSLFGMLIGFCLFRFFDIKKPLGINKLQSLEGGFGCVADDIAAAVFACVSLNLIGLAIPSIYEL